MINKGRDCQFARPKGWGQAGMYGKGKKKEGLGKENDSGPLFYTRRISWITIPHPLLIKQSPISAFSGIKLIWELSPMPHISHRRWREYDTGFDKIISLLQFVWNFSFTFLCKMCLGQLVVRGLFFFLIGLLAWDLLV